MWFRNEAIIIGTPVEPVQHSLQASLEVAWVCINGIAAPV